MLYNNPDLHMHSIVSDGSDSPVELLDNIKKNKIDIFSLTDHDSYEGCIEMQKLLQPGDPMFLNGIELTCYDELGKYHILGYCFDVNKESIKKAAAVAHIARREKAEKRLAFLQNECGFTFSKEDITELFKNENPGRPHFANLLYKYGYIKNKQEGFDLLANYHVKVPKLSPVDAIDAIMQSNGIPVLAHGILADGSKHLTEEEIELRVKHLKDCGLMGLECYYSTFTESDKAIMLNLASKYDLLITVGSDYHGTNKTIHLGQTNSPNPKDLKRFYRTVEMFYNI